MAFFLINYDSKIDCAEMSLKELDITWNCIVVLLSLSGNTLLLVASRRHKALTLDRVSVVILENLAIADIGLTLLLVVPNLTSLWVRGCFYTGRHSTPLMDDMLYVVGRVCLGTNCTCIAFLSVSKLMSLLSPFRVRNFRSRDGYLIVITVWIAELLLHSAFLLIDKYQLIPNFNFYSDIATIFFMSVVIVSLAAISIGTLFKVWKARQGVSTQGIKAIFITGDFFALSVVPLVISNIYSLLGGGIRNSVLDRVALNTINITCFCNPMLYYLTIRSFKEHVDKMISRKFSVQNQINVVLNRPTN